MANEIQIAKDGSMVVASRLPSFPASSSDGVFSGSGGGGNDKTALLKKFEEMHTYLKEISFNTKGLVSLATSITKLQESLEPPKQKENGLKEKEQERESAGSKIQKKMESFTEKTKSAFEKLMAVLFPMIFGFFLGISDLTKPMGLLKAALYTMITFLGVKVLGGLLIKSIGGMITSVVSFLATKLVNAIIAVIRSARGTAGVPIPDPTPTGGKGRGKPKPGKAAPKGRMGLYGALAGLAFGAYMIDDDDSAGEQALKAGGGLVAGAATEYGVRKAADKISARQAAKPAAIIAKEGTEQVAKRSLVKGAAKTVAKKIPVIGALAGLGFAANRAMQGDWKGASMEAGSGLLGGVGFLAYGTGTVASIAVDAGLVARDIQMQKDVDKIQELLANAGNNDARAKKTLQQLEAAQKEGKTPYEQLKILEDSGYDAEKLVPQGKAAAVSPTPKAVSSTTKLDQTRQQRDQKARQTPPAAPAAPSVNNVVQTNNVNNGTTITKPPRAERESLSYGK